ncbi:MAG: TadE/TadG family type IV pilus assembly protein, partial [Woeseiaceae bacterium]
MKRVREFFGRDDGSATVESVLWLPTYLLIIGFVFDSTMLMMGQTQLWT